MTTTISGSDIQNSNNDRIDALHLIDTQTASSSATIDFLLPSGYYKYQIVFDQAVVATDGAELLVQLSDDAGSSFYAGSGHYSYANYYQQMGSANAGTAFTGTSTGGQIFQDWGSDTDEAGDGVVTIINPSASKYQRVMWECAIEYTDGNVYHANGGCVYTNAKIAADAVRLIPSTSTIESGTFKLYGWVS